MKTSIDKIIPRNTVRLIDVFVIAPFLIYSGYQSDKPLVRKGLIILGIATAIYNGMNFIEENKQSKDE